jgi:phosphoribosylformylglycinamidine (FGAM) synthase-like amidotransferase family enzyme
VTMSDILAGRAELTAFAGVVFVGGFSYADTLDSAKGWAAAVRFSPAALAQFERFAARPDTFSLGVCNGCQLMALLGWVPRAADGDILPGLTQPRFIHNASGAPTMPVVHVHCCACAPCADPVCSATSALPCEILNAALACLATPCSPHWCSQ